MLLQYCVITGLNCTNEEQEKDIFKYIPQTILQNFRSHRTECWCLLSVQGQRFQWFSRSQLVHANKYEQFNIVDNPYINKIIKFLRESTNELKL